MRTIVFVFLFYFTGNTFAQVTDTDIVNSLLGKQYYEVNPNLDTLGIWYHAHYPENIKSYVKVYSIADGDGTVKLFTLKLDENVIEEIIINYQHDSREQIEDFTKITSQTSHHVEKYSTDMLFKVE
jgi:hypothetical protein